MGAFAGEVFQFDCHKERFDGLTDDRLALYLPRLCCFAQIGNKESDTAVFCLKMLKGQKTKQIEERTVRPEEVRSCAYIKQIEIV